MDASLTLIWISKGSLTNAPVVTEHGISERLNFGNKSTTAGKKKKNIQRKMRTHPNMFQFLHWQRTPTSHCLFAAALARLGQSCIGAQEEDYFTAVTHSLCHAVDMPTKWTCSQFRFNSQSIAEVQPWATSSECNNKQGHEMSLLNIFI